VIEEKEKTIRELEKGFVVIKISHLKEIHTLFKAILTTLTKLVFFNHRLAISFKPCRAQPRKMLPNRPIAG